MGTVARLGFLHERLIRRRREDRDIEVDGDRSNGASASEDDERAHARIESPILSAWDRERSAAQRRPDIVELVDRSGRDLEALDGERSERAGPVRSRPRFRQDEERRVSKDEEDEASAEDGLERAAQRLSTSLVEASREIDLIGRAREPRRPALPRPALRAAAGAPARTPPSPPVRGTPRAGRALDPLDELDEEDGGEAGGEPAVGTDPDPLDGLGGDVEDGSAGSSAEDEDLLGDDGEEREGASGAAREREPERPGRAADDDGAGDLPEAGGDRPWDAGSDDEEPRAPLGGVAAGREWRPGGWGTEGSSLSSGVDEQRRAIMSHLEDLRARIATDPALSEADRRTLLRKIERMASGIDAGDS